MPDRDTQFSQKTLFGRRKGRSLTSLQDSIIANVLPEFQIPSDLLRENFTTPPSQIFNRDYKSYVLEIGFGRGERLSEHGKKIPECGFIGAEPFINGMATFLKSIKNLELKNIRVLMDDGMIIARSLAPESIDAIYILNPDPWHKTRHHKRRIINKNNLDVFSKILKPHGNLIMTTDVENLAEWMVTQATIHPNFRWTAQSVNDCLIPPQNWIPTRYETKGAKGTKKMIYLIFQKCLQ